MRLHYLVPLLLLCSGNAFADAQTQPELQVPLGATWTMSLDQAQRLPGLERAPNGALKASSTIRSNSQVEVTARWQGRAVSLLFAHGFGLYAIAVEMIPWGAQHYQLGDDPEQQDLEHCAPVRLAILRKYGAPTGMAQSWDAPEVLPLAQDRAGAPAFTETTAVNWSYARNWLIWERGETRLALGDRFVWYISKTGLAYREKAKQALEKQQQAKQERDEERQAQRQRQLDHARQEILLRAQELEPLF